jgi:hypothetical protein
MSYVKVNVPLTDPKARGGGVSDITLLFLGLSLEWESVISTSPRPLYPGKDPVPIVQEAGWDPGPFWTCAKNLVPTGIRSPDRTARSQLLYRLS